MPYIICFPISIATIMDGKCETNLNPELFPHSPTCNVPGATLQLCKLNTASGGKEDLFILIPGADLTCIFFRILLFMIVDKE